MGALPVQGGGGPGVDVGEQFGRVDLRVGVELFAYPCGELVGGVRYRKGVATTHSLVMRGRSGTIRRIDSEHQLSKLRAYSAINFDRAL